MSDPTQKGNGLTPDIAKLRRPLGQIIIEWDPNTLGLGFKINGLMPVEEIGLLQWMINLRMAQHMKVLPTPKVEIASPGQMPPPPSKVS